MLRLPDGNPAKSENEYTMEWDNVGSYIESFLGGKYVGKVDDVLHFTNEDNPNHTHTISTVLAGRLYSNLIRIECKLIATEEIARAYIEAEQTEGW